MCSNIGCLRVFLSAQLDRLRQFVPAILFSITLALSIWSPASALTISATDLWNGATVTASSAIHPASNANDMFGAVSAASEPGNTVFADGLPINTIHSIECQTAAAITLRSFVLFAAHDGPPRDANQRGFNHFELYAYVGGSYQSIFSYDTPALLYGNNVAPPNSILETNATLNNLFLGVNLLPVTSDKFRAVFVQYGIAQCCESGPRIAELDGFDTYLTQASIPEVPIPAALPLFATGLGALGLLGWRRKRKQTA
jgi:hypothetical protein